MPPTDALLPTDVSTTVSRGRAARPSRREKRLLLALIALTHLGIATMLANATNPRPRPEAPHVTVTLIAPVPAPAAAPVPPTPAPAAPSPAPEPVPPPPPAPTPTAPQAPPPATRPTPAPRPATRPTPAPPVPESAPPSAPTAVPAAAATGPAPAASAPASTASDTRAPPTTFVEARHDAAYLDNPKPDYPPRSRRMREQGQVLLRVFVTRDGRPGKVELFESSGYPRLDRAAETGVAQWRFVPARQGENSVDSWIVVPIIFALEGN